MRIDDSVYGTVQITEPVLVELIESDALQRLKGISQYGAPDEYYGIPSFSRFDHSVGVMILLQRLGASLEEQIAGLLHDVSHTAFSHTGDWVLGDQEKEELQDKNHKKFILETEIPKILSRYGIDFEAVIDTKKFTILERDAPFVCADRVDYCLRDYYLDRSDIKTILDNILVRDGRIVFANKEAAGAFGRNFMKCQKEHWQNIEFNVRTALLSKALYIALQKGIITVDELYKEDDDYNSMKLKESEDPEILRIIELLSGKLNYEWTETNPNIKLRKKFRWIDPEYLNAGEVHRLSEDPNYSSLVEEVRKLNEIGVSVRIAI